MALSPRDRSVLRHLYYPADAVPETLARRGEHVGNRLGHPHNSMFNSRLRLLMPSLFPFLTVVAVIGGSSMA